MKYKSQGEKRNSAEPKIVIAGVGLTPEEYVAKTGHIPKFVTGGGSPWLDATGGVYKKQLAQIRKALRRIRQKRRPEEEIAALRDLVLFYQRLYRERDPQKEKQILDELQNFLAANKEVLENAQKQSVTLPEIEDPTDKRIWDIVSNDPSITDAEIAQRLGNLKRPQVNARRRTLEKMGYTVRVSRQK